MANSKNILKTTARVAATLVIVAIAGVLGWFAWQHYVYAPWTRDARVQADVINIAPEVSGTVADVAVADDSYVHKGDLLFKIQPIRFKHSVAEAEASLAQARAQEHYAQRNARRLEKLPPGGVSTQNLQQAQSNAESARASVAQAKAQLAQAKQNLEWATVRSPVNGYVTHLLLDQGDYATQGSSAMTLVDAETFRVTAYFEETKLAKIAVGDPADITLMAGDTHLKGHVASIGRGIAVGNNAPGERNLPNVNPTFQWVRLAQRVPVTIAFDQAPQKLPLSVGLTATVHVHPDATRDNRYDASAHKGHLRWSPARSGQFDDADQGVSAAPLSNTSADGAD
ncbi:MAG: HlyD family secretion protein [Salinisphaera sp.]|uniref:efflux RND transporter periplasmic adaptor subunit n=1 Tax=Salinisphaera sp. TaxID=1914330 RepID=UPI003C7C6570